MSYQDERIWGTKNTRSSRKRKIIGLLQGFRHYQRKVDESGYWTKLKKDLGTAIFTNYPVAVPTGYHLKSKKYETIKF